MGVASHSATEQLTGFYLEFLPVVGNFRGKVTDPVDGMDAG